VVIGEVAGQDSAQVSPDPHAPLARQGRTRPQACRASRGGQHRGISRSRRHTPPLLPPGRVVPQLAARHHHHDPPYPCPQSFAPLRIPPHGCRWDDSLRTSTVPLLPPSPCWSLSLELQSPPSESDEVLAKDTRFPPEVSIPRIPWPSLAALAVCSLSSRFTRLRPAPPGQSSRVPVGGAGSPLPSLL
jgi:hypothetical protein